MPIDQSIQCEWLVTLKSANALGVTIPPLLARADEVIERAGLRMPLLGRVGRKRPRFGDAQPCQR